jgi:hypothetical protein
MVWGYGVGIALRTIKKREKKGERADEVVRQGRCRHRQRKKGIFSIMYRAIVRFPPFPLIPRSCKAR